jgi:hypothetical protein
VRPLRERKERKKGRKEGKKEEQKERGAETEKKREGRRNRERRRGRKGKRERVSLEEIKLSEISQTLKDKYCMINMCNLKIFMKVENIMTATKGQ